MSKIVYCVRPGYSSAPSGFGCFPSKSAAMKKAKSLLPRARREKFSYAVWESKISSPGIFTSDRDKLVWSSDDSGLGRARRVTKRRRK